MSIDLSSANTYFESSVDNAVWTGFGDLRENAIAQAKRELSAFKGDEIDTDTTENGDHPREDCAVYEYAFNLLVNSSAVGSGAISSPDELFGNIEKGKQPTPVLTRKVMRYMGWDVNIRRG